jgi:hypothetical protein
MRALLERAKGHRGAPKVQAALDAYGPRRKFTRSEFERRFLEMVCKAGLPEPAMNVFVAGQELDAYWEEARFEVKQDLARPGAGSQPARPPRKKKGFGGCSS